MSKAPTELVPPHLAPLFARGVAGATKLLAAWDGLSDETRILVLHKLNANQIDWPFYYAANVRRRALDSPNAYLRYLAVKKIYLEHHPDADLIRTRIESDPSDLVKYVSLEDPWGLFKKEEGPQAFFSQPHAARVAMMLTVDGEGEGVASVVKYACESLLPIGGATEQEIHELVNAYLTSEKTLLYYADDCGYDGWAKYTQGKDLEALWDIIPLVPELVAHELIRHLPAFAGPADSRRGADAAESVAGRLDEWQLGWLLYRDDVKLPELRKKTFLGCSDDGAKYAAAAHHFDLAPDEFSTILEKPIAERVGAVKMLASAASDLNLALLEAVYDYLFAVSEVDGFSSAFETAEFARIKSKKQLEILSGYKRKQQILDLDLYHLACSVVPWKSSNNSSKLPEKFEFLSDCICPGNTWLTYSKMRTKWRDRFRNEDPLQLLPGESDEGDYLDSAWDVAAIVEHGSSQDLNRFVTWASSQLSLREHDSQSQLFSDVGRLAEKLFERSLANEQRIADLNAELLSADGKVSALRTVTIATLAGVVILLLLQL